MNLAALTAHLDIDVATDPRVAFTLAFADRFGADTDFLCAAEPLQIIESGLGHVTAADVVRREAAAIEASQREIHDSIMCKAPFMNGVVCSSAVLNPTEFVRGQSCASDLTILFEPNRNHPLDPRRTVDIADILVSSGRPVLLPSHSMKAFDGGTVVVAWKDGKEARRAVSGALPVLARARDVVVLSVREQHSGHGDTRDDVVRYLSKHGISSRKMSADRPSLDVGASIISVARELKSDLIVAGAYSHSRLREWVFGGVTRSLLENASINRLLST
ncbi:universal stress protein [Rhizobium sp. RAF56]|uniref:universal stress protein n=1 Tax=Rhizobium sp. RAF56 TaxID=3233062 RepID=UPI003F99BA60